MREGSSLKSSSIYRLFLCQKKIPMYRLTTVFWGMHWNQSLQNYSVEVEAGPAYQSVSASYIQTNVEPSKVHDSK